MSKYTDYIYSEKNERAKQELTIGLTESDIFYLKNRKTKKKTRSELIKFGYRAIEFLDNEDLQEVFKKHPKAELFITIHLEGHE